MDPRLCELEPPRELTPRILVFGVGGAGGNAVNNMIDKGLEGVEFVAANTDAQALTRAQAGLRLQLGGGVTGGLGAGADPEVGARAAQEAQELIAATLEGANMCFVTAGMGGGTGTGAAPVIARMARAQGVLTVGVVTKPFSFEGSRRMRVASGGIDELEDSVDTLIVIPNQNLFRVANERTTFTEAFQLADDVLYQGVKGVTDLMVKPGLVNLDFADVRAVMNQMGKAMMGAGEASGERRAVEAAERAIDNPLLDDVTLKGARGVLINITGGPDLGLYEADEAANRISSEAHPDASVIFGANIDPELGDRVRVSIVATGIGMLDAESGAAAPAPEVAAPKPVAGAAGARPATGPLAAPTPTGRGVTAAGVAGQAGGASAPPVNPASSAASSDHRPAGAARPGGAPGAESYAAPRPYRAAPEPREAAPSAPAPEVTVRPVGDAEPAATLVRKMTSDLASAATPEPAPTRAGAAPTPVAGPSGSDSVADAAQAASRAPNPASRRDREARVQIPSFLRRQD